jgi:ankyrin repeat protein
MQMSLMHDAAYRGDEVEVRRLLQSGEGSTIERTSEGYTPLLCAAQECNKEGRLRVMLILLKHHEGCFTDREDEVRLGCAREARLAFRFLEGKMRRLKRLIGA